MARRLRTLASFALLTAAALTALAAPASAQQPVNSTTQGGLAFIIFAVMVALFAASLFYMDRLRKRREE